MSIIKSIMFGFFIKLEKVMISLFFVDVMLIIIKLALKNYF